MEVICLVDESRIKLDTEDFPKISITSAAMKKLGLHRPKGFQWRCGDYGLYLANIKYPNAEHFWLVEYDVRLHSDNSMGEFLAHFNNQTADLIAPMLGQRQNDWWWYAAMTSRESPVYGCLFPFLRVSRQLIVKGLEERKRLGRSPIYRMFWPNDESFLVTTAIRHGLECRDINSFDKVLYTDHSFSFENPHSGEQLARSANDDLLYHPVLFGPAYQQKRNRIAKVTTLYDKVRRKTRLIMKSYV